MPTIQSVVMTKEKFEEWCSKPNSVVDGCSYEGFNTDNVYYLEKHTQLEGKDVVIVSGLFTDGTPIIKQEPKKPKVDFNTYIKNKKNGFDLNKHTDLAKQIADRGYILDSFDIVVREVSSGIYMYLKSDTILHKDELYTHKEIIKHFRDRNYKKKAILDTKNEIVWGDVK